MNISKSLDLAIKLSEDNTDDGGYCVDGKIYNTYMTKDEWDKFKTSMSSSSLEEFGEGGGGELVEKSGRPPKMACYGSSSRMIYTLSRHKPDFHYEKKLPTTIGGTANIDGFYENKNKYVFVEAKCHEPYSAKSTLVSENYKKLYCFINDHMSGNVEFEIKSSERERYMNVEFLSCGEKLRHFDIKQMICHLLGIATGILKKEFIPKQIDFVYLLYDPTDLDLASNIKLAVDSIYERTCYECNLIDFTTLFRVILTFLNEEKYGSVLSKEKIDKIACQFEFALTSQKSYPILLH